MNKCTPFITIFLHNVINSQPILDAISFINVQTLSKSNQNTIHEQILQNLTNRFKERSSTFNAECKNIKSAPKLLDPYFQFPQYILTTQKYNTLACLPMKTGCSSWFFAFHELEYPNITLAKDQGFGYIGALPKFKDKTQNYTLFLRAIGSDRQP